MSEEIINLVSRVSTLDGIFIKSEIFTRDEMSLISDIPEQFDLLSRVDSVETLISEMTKTVTLVSKVD